MTLGTNASVNSWICVADWNSETANPITSEVMSTGAASLPATSSASTAMWMTAVSFMALSRVVALDEGRDDQAPTVDEDEEQQLEGQGDRHRRQHHHAERHQ